MSETWRWQCTSFGTSSATNKLNALRLAPSTVTNYLAIVINILPNELIREIFFPMLDVPDEMSVKKMLVYYPEIIPHMSRRRGRTPRFII
jgi:hypothetical protein